MLDGADFHRFLLVVAELDLESFIEPVVASVHAKVRASPLAGQVKAGRKKGVTAGFMNDVEAIAAYAPLVDAMFIDKECALLLTQGRPGKELDFRARIFSLTNREEFLDYLRGLEAQADAEVHRYAEIIYGLDPAP